MLQNYEDKANGGYLKDIIDCIQDGVDTIVEKCYASDEICPPTFVISILYENKESQKILLNCTHAGRTFSRVLFPRDDSFYGYSSLGEFVEYLYNQTM